MTIHDCDICNFAAPSILCGVHTLNYGVVRELFQCQEPWGDIIYDAELEVLENETSEEKAVRAAREMAEDAMRAKSIMTYSVDLRKKLYTNQTTGLAPIRFGRHCKKERYHGESCPNKMLQSTSACDPTHGCGCRLHNERKGACSFVHADEEAEMVALFGNFGMKMLDDKPFITMLFKTDCLKEKAKANPAARYMLEKEVRALEMETDAIEFRFKGEQKRCKLWQIVNANGSVSYSKTSPDNDSYSAKSSGRSSTGKPPAHNNKKFFNTTDNSAW